MPRNEELKKEYGRKYYHDWINRPGNREKKRANQRKKYRNDPEWREKQLAYGRAYRAKKRAEKELEAKKTLTKEELRKQESLEKMKVHWAKWEAAQKR